MAKSNVGGGIKSNKLVRPAVKYGERARAINEKGVSQIGQTMGNRATDRGPMKRSLEHVNGAPKPSVALGNQVAKNVGAGAPGAGRTVYRTGTQDCPGPVAGTPKPASPDTLAAYGPEKTI